MSAESALTRLENLCSRAEHCSAEIREKLRKWQLGSSDAEKIMERLVKSRYIDDSRYARAFVRDKYRFSRWGRRKIALALRAKRIDKAEIEDAFEEIDEEEYASGLKSMLKSKLAALSAKEDESDSREAAYAISSKLYKYALSRGFESELSLRIIKALMRHQA